jgi:hypothetical protein
MTTAAGGAELEAEETLIAAGTNLVNGETMTLDLSVDYQYTRYEYTGLGSRDRDLHRLQLPLRLRVDMGGWQLAGYVAPGVSTSSNVMKDLFSEAGREDFLITGRITAERQRGDQTWFGGIAHDRRFGRSRAYPVAGVEFNPHDKVHVRLAIPDPEVTVALSPHQTVAVRVFPSGHQWHVVSNDFESDFDYRVESWRGQLSWRLPVWRSLGLDIAAGYEFDRAHYLTTDNGTRLGIDVDDQWFVALSLRIGTPPIAYTHGSGL